MFDGGGRIIGCFSYRFKVAWSKRYMIIVIQSDSIIDLGLIQQGYDRLHPSRFVVTTIHDIVLN